MKSYRPERVANVIREVVSDAISTRLNDPRIEPMSSVTRVEVSPDLEHAKVWVSVLGEASVGRRTISGLKAAAGYVQRLVGAELSLRTTPHLTFHLDESLKKAAETIRIINESMEEIRQKDAASQEHQEGNADTSSGGGA
ncbi:MAG TPA: 30S ribosome-binding factor RbfA [Phycisphaerae bacterium]|mgnify:CR=1 FL=1|jgi:ribosome-binding factor A|nr:30S ribosome-binding factor RbfA [Phycisphaerae bacterium]HOB74365.1 30S ribosome-binding factor RbfA [Phycisphaerae bacterium]HOJ54516.1 30S ribosome-binding factor RbfA [Phycisphaerae bacterium]HOL26545.1 30S ribosome-binding factor RbfA [Phycisphaerae bacterium]HPP20944.1 30S ribosome-binding factor RbfA [Phycisphaerae bacterium]